MLALKEIEDNPVGPHGIALDVATDPANQFLWRAPDAPTFDYAAQALEKAQKAYYARYDTPDNPISRAGHMWSVWLKKPDEK